MKLGFIGAGNMASALARGIGEPVFVTDIVPGKAEARVEQAYPHAAVHRFLPNIPVELRQGVLVYAARNEDPELVELFGRAGHIVRLPKEELVEPAMALMSCGPAFMALVAEALVDAGVLHGLDPAAATQLVVETMAGSAAVLRETDGDTRGLRRR